MENHDPLDHEVAASYMPRAFCIILNDLEFKMPNSGQELKFSPQNFPTFMHEVAHLVQDRSTFRGVIDFMELWDQVAVVAEHVRASANELQFPLVDLKTGRSRVGAQHAWIFEAEALRRLREPRVNWESDGRYWTVQSCHVNWIQTRLAGRQIRFPEIVVDFIDNSTGDEYQHLLGAWEIKEAYSVAVALLHGASDVQFGVSNFEYLVVERILTYFFGRITPRQIVSLCHWALQDLAPANALFGAIEHFHEGGCLLPDEHVIYEWCRDDALRRGFQQNCRDVLENVRQYELRLGGQDESLKLIFGWYRHHASYLIELHWDFTRQFPLDTFLCKESSVVTQADRDREVFKLFSEVEVPLVIWPDGSFYSISANRQATTTAVFLNRAIMDLLSRLWTSRSATWRCPLHAGCTLPMKDATDCLTSPWKKANLETTCPYGAAAKLMNLANPQILIFEPFNAIDESQT